MDLWVLVVRESDSVKRVIGPFGSPARASAVGLNEYGPLKFGNSYKWTVHELVAAS
jgi:hypothetical protein